MTLSFWAGAHLQFGLNPWSSFGVLMALSVVAVVLTALCASFGRHVGSTARDDPPVAMRSDLENTLDALPAMIASWDKNLRCRMANQAHFAWLGVDPKTMLGMQLRDLLGANLEKVQPFVLGVLRGEAQRFEVAIPRPDGSGPRQALVYYLPDLVDGEVQGFYLLAHDVTDQVESRARLAATLSETEALFSVIHKHAIVSVADRAGRILDVNDAFCSISGYSREELLHQDHRIINSAFHDRSFWLEMWRAIGSGRPWRNEICNRAKDGSLYWVDSIIAPYLDDNRKPAKYISIRFDITAAKRAAAELAVERERLDNILRGTNVGTWEWNVQTGQTRLNERWAELIGYSRAELGELDADAWFSHFRSEDLPHARALMDRHLRNESDHYAGELRLRHREGHAVWVIARGNVVSWTSDGRPEWMAGMHLDVSDHMRVKQALQQTNERFALAADSAAIGVWDYDILLETLTWDDRMYDLFHRERAGDCESIALLSSSIHPEDRASVEAALRLAIDGVQSFDTEFRIGWPDGEIRHIKATAQVIRDSEGKAIRMTGVNFDITERKRIAEITLQNERFMRIVTENVPGLVAYWTVDLRCTFANAAYRAWLGAGAEDPIGRRMSELMSEAQFRLDQPCFAAALRGDEARVERSSTSPDGSSHHYWIHYVPDRAGGEIKGIISVLIDVSELHAAQASLEELNVALQERTRQAEQGSVAKSAFLANMSHEIRTPLNAVIGLTYLLEQGNLDHGQASLVSKVKLASRSLLGVVNDVLDLSKIEAGEMEIEEATFDLRLLLDELLSVMAVQASPRDIQLHQELGVGLPGGLRGDVLHLRQILTNLVSNAIKFTEKGSVTLAVSTLEHMGARVVLRFAVRDTGIGIEPEVLTRLFTPFSQADVSTTRRFGGTGLGLSIVKRLSILMEGEVSVTSAPGVGSEFVVDLPFWVENQIPSTSARPLEVLVASDTARDRIELSSMARALGWRAEGVELGRGALDRVLERLTEGQPVAVVIIVASASDRGGLQTLTALRAGGPRQATLPAVLVTAGGLDQVDTAARQHLIDVPMVAAPVSSAALFDAVQHAVAARASAAPLEAAARNLSAARLQGCRLLVVDDSVINLEVAQRMLELEGAQVTVASNGQEAVDLLRNGPQAFDAVLMDVQMPVLDGIEATRRIRRDLGLKVPILALTAGALSSERERAADAGMDDFITKPFDPHAMIRKVSQRALRGRIVERPSDSRALRASSAPLTGWPAIDGFDAADTCARFCGDRELFTDMLARLCEKFSDFELSSAASEDPDRLARRLHTLSGSAGTVGARALSRAAKAAERALRRGEPGALTALSATLERELRRTRAASTQLLMARAAALTVSAPIASVEARASAGLDELMGLLAEQSIDALEAYASLAPELRARLDDEQLAALRAAMNALQYKTALRILGTERSDAAAAGPALG